jgi:hypothetical protein
MRRPLVSLALLAFASVLPAMPAHAQTRVFVGAQGSDANPCTFALPCRTFQHAHDTVVAGGEINVLDPAGYGAVTITKAISIQGHKFASVSPAASADAITINAGPNDRVNLGGLVIEGFGTGAAGVVFNTGASLNIHDSTIRNFHFDGIVFQPTTSSQLNVSQTLITDLGDVATAIIVSPPSGSPAITAALDHVTLKVGLVGLNVDNEFTGSMNVAIADSVISKFADGIDVFSSSGATNVVVRDCTVINDGTGITSTGPTTFVRVTRSTITANGIGLKTTSSGSLISFGDNSLDGNTTDGAPTSTIGYH